MAADPHPSRIESLYDRYLDAALRGDDVTLSRFGDDAVWLEALHDIVTPDQSAAEDLPFDRLGDYRLIRRLGEGGMGVVYLAEHVQLGRRVALKVLRPELAGSASAMARFEREAKAVARLEHPGIVGVHTFAKDRGVQFLIMDLLPGENLDVLLDRLSQAGETLPTTRALKIGIQLGEALQSAHEAGVIHRDLKPSNIRLLPGDRAMLMDFGLARDELETDRTLTRGFAGSPQYAAPEQVDPTTRRISERTDVYGLGATLYECLCGRPPFEDDSLDRLLIRVARDEPTAPRKLRPSLPRDLEIVLSKALEKDPERRYATAQEFAQDLRAVVELRTIRARPSSAWTRLVKTARRHPTRVSVAGFVLIAIASLVGLRHYAQVRAIEEAGELVAAAHRSLDACEEERLRVARSGFRLQILERASETRELNPGERRALATMQASRDEHHRAREVTFTRIQEDLKRALELDPTAVSEVTDARGHLYYQRWLATRSGVDPAAAGLYLRLMREHDLHGEWLARVEADGAFALQTAPSNVTVHLFQYARLADVGAGDELRIAAMRAHGPDNPMPPGRWCLRVQRDVAPLQVGDLILQLAGHELRDALIVAASDHADVEPGDRLATVDDRPVRRIDDIPPGSHAFSFVRAGRQDTTTVQADLAELGIRVEDPARALRHVGLPGVIWRNGEERKVELPRGLPTRWTASPHVICRDRELAATPIEPRPLRPGWYLTVLREPGFEELRLPFHIDNQAEHYAQCANLSAELWPMGTTPEDFVRVAADAFAWREDSFLMCEHEVTNAEWLRFVKGATGERFVPTSNEIEMTPDGPELADPSYAERPVRGVSWTAAAAYVDFRNRVDPQPGFEFALPTWNQWIRVCKGGDSRRYVYGNQSRPEWVGGSRYGASEPTRVLSHPIDESPYGVFDLAASVREWCEDEIEPGSGLRSVAGGSYLSVTPDELVIERTGLREADAAPDVGLRLVLRPRRAR